MGGDQSADEKKKVTRTCLGSVVSGGCISGGVKFSITSGGGEGGWLLIVCRVIVLQMFVSVVFAKSGWNL